MHMYNIYIYTCAHAYMHNYITLHCVTLPYNTVQYISFVHTYSYIIIYVYMHIHTQFYSPCNTVRARDPIRTQL